jgi:adenylyltransferase/sulfurtransferase
MRTYAKDDGTLSDDELLRYSRQILLPAFDIAGQQALKAARVLLVGLGGIGCPAALYLAAAGVGELTLADFDTVDVSNLSRQVLYTPHDVGALKAEAAAAALARQNPGLRLHVVTAALTADNLPALLEGVDLVVDGCDNFATRDAVNAACVVAAKPLVSAAVIGLSAQVTAFDARRADSPCYRCLYPAAQEAAEGCAESGILAPVAGLAGLLAATEALKILADLGQPLVGRLWLWDAGSAIMRTLTVRPDPDCSVCAQRSVKKPG